MAKVKLPLLSMAAAGQFGKAIAFYGCKQIQTARKYTIPTRPDTPAQKAQTSLFEKAVDAWTHWKHTWADVQAFRTLQSGFNQNASAYNCWLSAWMDSYKRGNTWTYLGVFEVTFRLATQLTIRIDGPVDTPVPILHWGTHFWGLTSSHAMEQGPLGVWTWTVAGLRPNTYYWFRVEAGVKWVNYGRTGLYDERTLPLPP